MLRRNRSKPRAKTALEGSLKTKSERRMHRYKSISLRNLQNRLREAQNPQNPKRLDLRLIYEQLIRYYREDLNVDAVTEVKLHLESVMSSYPKNELNASASSLMGHLLVKTSHLITKSYERGMSIYKLEGEANLALLAEDFSKSLHMEVELSDDASKIFSYKYDQSFEYWHFDEDLNQFSLVQDLGSCFEAVGDQLNKVVGLSYCDVTGTLGGVFDLNEETEVVLFRFEKARNKFEVVGAVEGTADASCVDFSLDGVWMVVGFNRTGSSGAERLEEGLEGARKDDWALKLSGGAERRTRQKRLFEEKEGHQDLLRVFQYDQEGECYQLVEVISPDEPQKAAGICQVLMSDNCNILGSLDLDGSLVIYKRSKKPKKGKKLTKRSQRQLEKSMNLGQKKYSKIQIIWTKASKITSASLSKSGRLLSVSLSHGEYKIYELSKNSKFAILGSFYSEFKPAVHANFSADENYVFFEHRKGGLRTKKIENLRKRKLTLEDGQVLEYPKQCEIYFIRFLGANSELLVASTRNLEGSGSEFHSYVFERNEAGVYKEVMSFEGNAYKFSISDDLRLFACVLYPKNFYVSERDFEGDGGEKRPEYRQKDFELAGEDPYNVLIPPGSKDIIVTTFSKKVLFFGYNKATKKHCLIKEVTIHLNHIPNGIRMTPDRKMLTLTTLGRKLKISQNRPKKGNLAYEITSEVVMDDVANDAQVSANKELIIAKLNNGYIQTFVRSNKASQGYQSTQKIKLFGQLGQWNDCNLHIFNNWRYMALYPKWHHFLAPEAHSELILYSINNNHVEKIESYGLVHQFCVGEKFGVVAVVEKNERNLIKLVDLRKDFRIPESEELTAVFVETMSYPIGSSQVTKSLFKISKIASIYLTSEGKQSYRMPDYGQGEPNPSSYDLEIAQKSKILGLKQIGDFLKNSKIHGYSAWNRLRDESKIHNQLDLPYIAITALNIEYLKSVLKVYGYRPLYYPKGFDPLEIALELNNIDLLDTIAESMIPKNKNLRYLISRLDLPLFVKIMSCSSPLLKKVVLEASFVLTEACDAIPIHSYPLRENEDLVIFPMSGMTLTTDLRQEIDKEMSKHRKLPQAKIRCSTFRFSFEPSLYSDSAYQILTAFNLIPGELKTGDYRCLIRQLWRSNYWIICGYSLIVLATSVLFSIFNAWYQDSLAIAALTVFSCIFLLLFELSSLLIDPKTYFQSYYNYLDLYIYTSRPLIVVLVYRGFIDEQDSELASAWINLTILIAGFRTMGELRVLSSTRVLMAMISQVVSDMTAFIVITLTMVLLFSVVAANIYKNDPERSVRNMRDFSLLMNHYYNEASGAWEDSIEDMRVSELFNFYLSGLALFLLMINLLIAVISLIFDNFQGKKRLHDLEELYEVMIGHCHFSQCLKRMRRCRRAKIAPLGCAGAAEVQENHFLYITRDEKDEEFERKILKRLDENQAQMSRMKELHDIQFSEVKQLIRKQFSEFSLTRQKQ